MGHTDLTSDRDSSFWISDGGFAYSGPHPPHSHDLPSFGCLRQRRAQSRRESNDDLLACFGEMAVVLHSALTGSQKFVQWRRIIEKKARVVIGARSAVFAPVPDLGLIIIDEEHDGSYKSGNSPRYSRTMKKLREQF